MHVVLSSALAMLTNYNTLLYDCNLLVISIKTYITITNFSSILQLIRTLLLFHIAAVYI